MHVIFENAAESKGISARGKIKGVDFSKKKIGGGIRDKIMAKMSEMVNQG